MIKAEIALSDLSFEPTMKQGALSLGASWIRPHGHPLLETVCVRAPGQWFLVVRERKASGDEIPCTAVPSGIEDTDEARFHALYQSCLLWPLDYVMIEVAQAGHRLRIRAGVLGAVPVYARVLDDKVTLTWDSAEFADRPAAIDTEVASHQLALHTLYAARQLYTGVVMLTERASLHVEPGRARFRYPEPVTSTTPSPEDGEDAVPRFADALQNVLNMRPWLGAASVELSGGMDSATVATALTQWHRDIDSKGILLDGDVRGPQVHRRRLIADRLGLSDQTVDIADYPPSLDLSPSQCSYGFCHDFYLDACAALWDSATARGRHVMFTGIGGDELFPAYRGEVSERATAGPVWARDARSFAEGLLTPRALSAARSRTLFDAPESPVPATSLLAQACRAADLLAHGQWPVNPLSDPRLTAFCHRLPRSSREGREVMRRYLENHLGADVFPKGYVKETFANVLPPLVARHAKTLATQLRECALADIGLVDRAAVLALLETIERTRAHPATSAFASFLWLERCARQAA